MTRDEGCPNSFSDGAPAGPERRLWESAGGRGKGRRRRGSAACGPGPSSRELWEDLLRAVGACRARFDLASAESLAELPGDQRLAQLLGEGVS